MTDQTQDVIDLLAGLDDGSPLAGLRQRRPATRDNAQASFDALFRPEYDSTVTPTERWAIAAFVTALHADDETADYYAAGLASVASSNIVAAIATEATAARTTGPYGRYPFDGPLAAESVDGPVYRTGGAAREVLGEQLAAGLEHTHLLVFRPRESSAAALQGLLDAGWSSTDIVTLSQIVAFLAFQVRVISGLRLLSVSLIEESVSA
jgi:CMD domain protein